MMLKFNPVVVEAHTCIDMRMLLLLLSMYNNHNLFSLQTLALKLLESICLLA